MWELLRNVIGFWCVVSIVACVIEILAPGYLHDSARPPT